MKIKVKDYLETGKEISITITNNGKKSTKTFYYTPPKFNRAESFDAKASNKTPIFTFLNMLLEDMGQKAALQVSKEQIKAKEDAEKAREWRIAATLKAFEARKKQELKDRKAAGLCNAILYFGPGHQTKTFCECKGPHKKHKANYGRYGEETEWIGMKGYTGY